MNPIRYAMFFGVLAGSLMAAPLWADTKLDQAKKKVEAAMPGIAFEDFKPSAVPGLYEAVVGTRVLYFSADGGFMLNGDMVDLKSRKNLSEAKRATLISRLLDQVGEANMIVMGPAKPKRTITVFTDVDCPYCAKLHLEVPELNKNGVKVRYLLFPRGGLDTKTYKRSVAVWCATDRVKAVGIAKAGGQIDMKTCDNPIAKHYQLGRDLGIEGTPTIFVDDGQVMPGYIPAANLLETLGIKKG
jgi:thiol:disulfide interchange protein DsbC